MSPSPNAATSPPVVASCVLSVRGNTNSIVSPGAVSAGGSSRLINPEMLSAGLDVSLNPAAPHNSGTSPPLAAQPSPQAMYQFNHSHLLSFGDCPRVRGMTLRQRERLGRRDMAYLLSNSCLRPHLILNHQIISPGMLYRIWRRALGHLLCSITGNEVLDPEMRVNQEQRVVAMLAFVQRLERLIQ